MIDTDKTILVVDDSDDDYEVLVRAFRINGGATNPLHRCEDGQQALDYLFFQGTCQHQPDTVRPAIILLDLNMPGINGYRVLAEIKGDDSLKSIPVIVMTTSDDERDIETCYRMGANTYIQKPISSSDFLDTIKRMTNFWLDCATLPGSQKISSSRAPQI